MILFGKTVMKKLQKKIIECGVKTIYLALDNDAVKDAINISENFINNGIDVRMMEFNEKDPNDIGFEKFSLKKTKSSGLYSFKIQFLPLTEIEFIYCKYLL